MIVIRKCPDLRDDMLHPEAAGGVKRRKMAERLSFWSFFAWLWDLVWGCFCRGCGNPPVKKFLKSRLQGRL